MRKTIFSASFVLFALFAILALPKLGLAKTIIIDNDFSDWEDVDSLATGTENVTGTDYWLVDDSWTTTEPAEDTMKVNQEKMLDILDFRITNDNDNMYVLMESVYPFMMVMDEATGFFYPFGYPLDYDDTGMPTSFVPDAPADFNHDMVLSFDVDQDNLFDYYGVTNFTWSAGSSGEDAMQITRTVYQDDGDGTYTPDTDTVIMTISNPEETVSADVELDTGQGLSTSQIEIANPIGEEGLPFLELGDTVNIRLETHSDIGDYTETVEYTLQETSISEDALIVGTGKGIGKSLGQGVVTAYNPTTGEELLSFTAYEVGVGARVAVGDVDGDGEQEIVTIPWKQAKNPQLKTFNLSGGEETSNRFFTKKRPNPWKNPLKFNLAVGDVNDDGVDEIVLINAKRGKLGLYILTLEEEKLKLVDRYFAESEGYPHGAWLEVANIDTTDDSLEIITAPLHGAAHFDLWELSDSEELVTLASYDIETSKPYSRGVHLAAKRGTIYTYLRLKGGKVNDYTYADGEFTKGEVAIDTLGLIGDLTTAGDNLAISAWKKKEVTVYNTDGEEVVTIDVGSKGAFLDYLNL